LELEDKTELQQGPIKLRLFRFGTERFALLTKDIAQVTNWRQPTPLPGAPEAVLGIVAVQARMITVLDTAKILEDSRPEDTVEPALVVALTGQEQLGLTATSAESTVEIPLADIEAAEAEGRPVLGYVREDDNKFQILDPRQLFAAAIRGKERRRRQR
jgi:purine-binding chemotaxis protein CheW